MWWYFFKLAEDENSVTYSYGYESKELTGVVVFDKKNDTADFKKYAKGHEPSNDDGRPVYLMVKKYGAPESRTIAFG